MLKRGFMANTPVSFTSSVLLGSESTNKRNLTAEAGFDALLGKSESQFSFIDDMISNILDSVSGIFQQTAYQPVNSKFPFLPSFNDTFGLSGPLPEWINRTTIKLNLTAEQNQALQTIAVNNKDITKTDTNVKKIAAELKAAGIGV